MIAEIVNDKGEVVGVIEADLDYLETMHGGYWRALPRKGQKPDRQASRPRLGVLRQLPDDLEREGLP